MPTAYVLTWARAPEPLGKGIERALNPKARDLRAPRHSEAELAGVSERLTVMATTLAKAKMDFER
jgi:hypothetical protein